jgi:hypothetical protein
MKHTFVAVSLIASGLASAFAGEIPIVGIDKNRQPFLKNVPSQEYQSRLAAMILGADSNIQPALARQTCPLPKKSGWLLRTVAIGIGAGVEAGLGPIIHASAKTRIRLVYTNSTNPVFPD